MKKTVSLIAALLMGFSGFAQTDMRNIQMVFIKGGNFYQGCDDKKYSGDEFENERPIHRVSVSSYSLGKYEVTLGQWRYITGVNPPAYNGSDYDNKDCDECPVVKVSYDDIQDFITKLNQKYPGKHYRLPTETEWEYAARGGKYSGNFKYAGSNNINQVAWYGKEGGIPHKVGTKKPNELGLYDMTGNVSEWCSDWYDGKYYEKTINALDPKGPEKGDKKILRGGCCQDDDVICRSTYRSRVPTSTNKWYLGFRLAMDY